MKINQKQKNIPKGWEKKRLDDVADFFNGKGHEKDIDENGEYVVVNSRFISTNGRIRKYSNEFLVPLEKGDVTMVMSDVPNGKAIAKCFFIDQDNKYTLNQRIGGFKSKKVVNKFLQLTINRNRYFLSFDDGVNQTNLRKDDILACPLILPDLPEQGRIVSVLETWDYAIDKLKQKIAIKKQIKKGLMQELLTGKKRLPGFSNEWQEMKLAKFISIKKGKALSSKDLIPGEYSVIAGGKSSPYSHAHYCAENAITVSASGAYAGYVTYHDYKFWGSDCSIIENLDNISDIHFIKHFLFFKQERIYQLQTGGAQPHIYPKDLGIMKVKLPYDLNEQEAIASILDTSEKQITTLESKLKYWQEQKKYLLNNLVTGQIRTPEDLLEKIN